MGDFPEGGGKRIIMNINGVGPEMAPDAIQQCTPYHCACSPTPGSAPPLRYLAYLASEVVRCGEMSLAWDGPEHSDGRSRSRKIQISKHITQRHEGQG